MAAQYLDMSIDASLIKWADWEVIQSVINHCGILGFPHANQQYGYCWFAWEKPHHRFGEAEASGAVHVNSVSSAFDQWGASV